MDQQRGRSRTDRITGAVLLLAGLAVILQAFHLRLGTFHVPGPGLFPLLVAFLILFLSLWLFLFPPKTEEKAAPSVSRQGLGRVGSVYLALLAFFAILKFAGFLISAFLLLFYLFYTAGRKKVTAAVVRALIAIVLSYLLFGVALKSELPKGLLGL